VTVSLTMLARPESSLTNLERVLPYVDEAVLTVLDTDEPALRTQALDKASTICHTSGKPVQLLLVSPDDTPDLYHRPAPGMFHPGHSLVGEDQPAEPFVGPLVSNWSAVRNRALAACTRDWRLALDADECVSRPELLAQICEKLDQAHQDACAIDVPGSKRGPRVEFRLSRACTEITYEGAAYESLEGYVNPVVATDGPTVLVDLCSPRIGPPDAVAFATLYRYLRENDWLVHPAGLLQLAENAGLGGWTVPVTRSFAKQAISTYLDLSLYPEGRAFAYALLGEHMEAQEFYTEASGCYTKSLREFPTAKAAMRLCRSRFREGRWRDVVEADEIASKLKDVPHLVDDWYLPTEATRLLVATALHKLGRRSEAQDLAQRLLGRCPNDPSVAALCAEICR
jgi:hypothetical protein